MPSIDLNFDLTPDQIRLREETHRFAAEVMRPAAMQLDDMAPEDEMGWGNSGLSISLGVTSMPFRFAAMTGNPDLMREVVRPYLDDTEGKYVGCWGATEPQ